MRRKRKYTREIQPDLKYSNIAVAKFTNYVMRKGKKSTAERVVYGAFDLIEKQYKKEPLKVFESAFENAGPTLEIKSRRIGGATYQVPHEVRGPRRFFLACNWIIAAARAKKGKSMVVRLADELVAAANNEGSAIKKKLDTHRMAEANKAFAHFAR